MALYAQVVKLLSAVAALPSSSSSALCLTGSSMVTRVPRTGRFTFDVRLPEDVLLADEVLAHLELISALLGADRSRAELSEEALDGGRRHGERDGKGAATRAGHGGEVHGGAEAGGLAPAVGVLLGQVLGEGPQRRTGARAARAL